MPTETRRKNIQHLDCVLKEINKAVSILEHLESEYRQAGYNDYADNFKICIEGLKSVEVLIVEIQKCI